MSEEIQADKPAFFVYDENGVLDVESTLKTVPENLDKNNDFFREVPEWFEVTPLEEALKFVSDLENIPEDAKKGLDEKALEQMHKAFREVLKCVSLYEKKDLTPAQKEFMRCINYYTALYAMDTMPVPDEEEDGEQLPDDSPAQ